MRSPRLALVLALLLAAGCRDRAEEPLPGDAMGEPDVETALATFGGGCFWCTEAIFAEVDGVLSVESGYAGGELEDPTYEEVCSGATGHAEVIQVTYDPAKVEYATLLEIFFKTHDPTSLNRQGADVGTQYRSIVLTHSKEQAEVARKVKKELDAADIWDRPIVTAIVPFDRFYPAEDYHQDYYAENANQPYCQAVITPKLEKFRKVFAGHRKRAQR